MAISVWELVFGEGGCIIVAETCFVLLHCFLEDFSSLDTLFGNSILLPSTALTIILHTNVFLALDAPLPRLIQTEQQN